MIMTNIIFLIFIFILECQAFFLPKSCQSDEDCKETQCCLSVEFSSFPKICHMRPEEGDLCLSENATINKIIPTCPCGKDMKCVSTNSTFKLSVCTRENKDDNITEAETETTPVNVTKPETETETETVSETTPVSETTTENETTSEK